MSNRTLRHEEYNRWTEKYIIEGFSISVEETENWISNLEDKVVEINYIEWQKEVKL